MDVPDLRAADSWHILWPLEVPMSLPLWLALTASPAHGFCGTYMGGAGAELYNEVSQVALVREGRSTVLSVSNDVDGNFEDFALIIGIY